ncbi:MAG: class I SAM-dependent methyltransferase [Candidatus Latescibacterota bacterium]
MSAPHDLPRLYSELCSWWPVLSRPADYAEEAEACRELLEQECQRPLRTVLELGCGGGNNASHLKRHFSMTLTDRSPGMLRVSQALNPGCEHALGDMRTLRLGRRFDAVFVHDAVMYMVTRDDLRQAIATAHAHCQPGGVALFAPDATRESFRPSTRHGGHDAGDRSLRYLEWSVDPDPAGTWYETHFAYLLQQASGPVRCEYDRHVRGLFDRGAWLALIAEAGFTPKATGYEHSEAGSLPVFLGLA